MCTYFAALIFGMYVISAMVRSSSGYVGTALCGLFSFVGAPVAAAIGFYSNKAKAENIEKIKQNGSTSFEDFRKEDVSSYKD